MEDLHQLQTEQQSITQALAALQERMSLIDQKLNKIWRPSNWTFENPINGGTKGLKFTNSKTAAPVGLQDTSGSSGTTMTTGHRFNGNTGTTYYSVGDIVAALKTLGLIT